MSRDAQLITNEVGYELEERLTISEIAGKIPVTLAELAYNILA